MRRVRTNVDGRLPSPQPQVNEINALFYNYSGVLQRDARPAGTSGGELVDDLPEGGPDAEQIREMAASVVASSRKIDELAAALPEIDLDQGAQLKRIAKLQEENDALEKELLAEMERAEKTLARTSAVFAAVTDAYSSLQRREVSEPMWTSSADAGASARQTLDKPHGLPDRCVIMM